ncbi:hypothetical protein INR49_011206 [Caranx melampygus]|nr:hypothetical protein INR49_011206 [Caranx melampygus]
MKVDLFTLGGVIAQREICRGRVQQPPIPDEEGAAVELSTYRYRVGVVYLKLCGLVVTVGRPGGEQVEEHLEQSCSPVRVKPTGRPLYSHLSLLVKAQDIIAHTAGPATLHLVLVPEELLAGKAPAIVQFPMRQHSQ